MSKRAEKETPSEAWVYILQCNDNSLYTGWTTDPDARLAVHNAGKGAKYTKPRLPVQIVYRERLADKNEALRRECEIKSMSRAQKLALIQTNINNK